MAEHFYFLHDNFWDYLQANYNLEKDKEILWFSTSILNTVTENFLKNPKLSYCLPKEFTISHPINKNLDAEIRKIIIESLFDTSVEIKITYLPHATHFKLKFR